MAPTSKMGNLDAPQAHHLDNYGARTKWASWELSRVSWEFCRVGNLGWAEAR